MGGAGHGWEQRRVKWVEMSVRAAGVKERFEDGGESCCEGWLETVEPEVAVFRCADPAGPSHLHDPLQDQHVKGRALSKCIMGL